MYPVRRVEITIRIKRVIPTLRVFGINNTIIANIIMLKTSPLSVTYCIKMSRVGFPTFSEIKKITF
jgi:hypothetical protein